MLGAQAWLQELECLHAQLRPGPEFRLAHNHGGISAVTSSSELRNFALGLSVVGCLAAVTQPVQSVVTDQRKPRLSPFNYKRRFRELKGCITKNVTKPTCLYNRQLYSILVCITDSYTQYSCRLDMYFTACRSILHILL